jgi:sulfonate transport system permease protein
VKSASLLRGIGGIVLFLLFWEGANVSGVFRFESVPPPSAIVGALLKLLMTRTLFEEAAHTISAALVAWGIAVVVGVFIGAALGLLPALRTYAMATVEFMRPLPPVGLVPMAMLLFGFSIKTELFVIAIAGVWPVLIGTMGGVMAVSARLRDVAQCLRLSKADMLLKVFIPAASPSMLVGCRLSLSTSLVLAIVVEMIGNPEGLGHAVVREAQALDRETMFAYVVIIGFLGIVFNTILVGVSRAVLPGQFNRAGTRAGA